MHVYLTNFNGTPNVGLFGITTDDYVLLGKDVPEAHDQDIEKALQHPIKRITIAGTSLIGVFCQWANGKLLIPQITFDQERQALEQAGIPYTIIKTKLTCLGNNIIHSSKAGLLNPDFKDEEVEAIQEALGVPCERSRIMEIEALGAVGVIRDGKGLFHRDIPPVTVKELEEKLGIAITLGTVNMGNPYIKSGLLLGEQGFIIGDASGGPEITNADEALGFLE
ncbi:translation initiation factor IF-6 [Candidatus Woesearchaeota archaeon]|nr:translation initiation factor IF-6 [Candidatus Woesearchaeota archaeon]